MQIMPGVNPELVFNHRLLETVHENLIRIQGIRISTKMALSHKKLNSWYLQLAQSQQAGLTLAESLLTSAGPPASDLQAMAAQIEQGASIDSLLRAAPKWLPQSDRYFISAAAATGRLPQMFQNLAERHAMISSKLRQLILGLLYPVAVLNFAFLVLPIMKMIDYEAGFSFNWQLYLTSVLLALGSFWGGAALIYALVKLESPVVPILMQWIPGLRGYYNNNALSNFAFALGSFLHAGLDIDKSWAGAARVSGDRKLARATARVRAVIDAGLAPGNTLSQHRVFPDDFRALYLSGERSGQLDTNLLTLGQSYQEKANHCMSVCAIAYPIVVLIGVAVFMGYHIVGQYLKYYSTIFRLLDQ